MIFESLVCWKVSKQTLVLSSKCQWFEMLVTVVYHWYPPSLLELQIIPCPLANARKLTVDCLSFNTGDAHVRERNSPWMYSTCAVAACVHPFYLFVKVDLDVFTKSRSVGRVFRFQGWESAMQKRIRTNVLIPGLGRLPSGSLEMGI